MRELVEETLVDNVIPDLLFDVLAADPGGEYDETVPEEDQEVYEAGTTILDEIVQECVAGLCTSSIRAILDDYLHDAMQRRQTNPLLMVTEALLADFIREILRGILCESVKELVAEHLEDERCQIAYRFVTDEVLPPLISDVAAESREEVDVAETCESLLEEVMRLECHAVVRGVLLQRRATEMEKRSDIEHHDIFAVASQQMVDSLALQHITSIMARRGEGMVLREQARMLADQLLVDQLVNHMRAVDARRAALFESRPTELIYRDMTAKAGFVSLLEQLGDELENDESRIHVEETAARRRAEEEERRLLESSEDIG